MHPVASRSGVLPLEGLTVVDLTQVLAGPFTTQSLGDLGADVIKVEAIGRGDRSRAISPTPEYFDTLNRNKRSIAIDLKSDDGREVARRLTAEADVFVESMKPGRAEKFGLSYEAVRDRNPGIVYCSISGFGRDSPYEDMPAWDMLIQAMSGIMSMTGEPDGPPTWSGLPSGDLAAAMYATQSVLAALYTKERDEIDTEWIEIPMFDAAVSWLSCRAGHSFGTGDPFPRNGSTHPSMAPFGAFTCEDGRIVVAAGTDSLWEYLCAALDRPDLARDDRFETLPDRLENRTALRETLNSIFGERSEAALLDCLRAHEVPAGPIHDTLTVWQDEHVQRRELDQRMAREGRRDATVIDHPIHFAELATHLGRAPEELGESTDEILRQVGFGPDEIARLRESDRVG